MAEGWDNYKKKPVKAKFKETKVTQQRAFYHILLGEDKDKQTIVF